MVAAARPTWGADGGEPVLTSYMRAVLHLRDSIRRNRSDAEFADVEGHQIVYIFDANVFIFHADLQDRTRLTKEVQQLLGNRGGDALGEALERLTASFLFSGKLPGQEQPCFMSLPHFSEVLGHLERIGRKLARGGRAQRRMGAGHRARISEIVTDSKLKPTEKLARLGGVVPEAVLSTLDASAHFARTLRTAFLEDEGRLVPLDRREWGIEAAAAAENELQDWLTVLPKSGQKRTDENLRDDARTLQTIVNLYRANADSEQAGQVKYVLVTADESLASAVARRAPDLEAEGIPDFVRSPRDYTPLLNLTAMGEAMSRHGVSDEMNQAFGSIFDTLGSALDWATPVSDGPVRQRTAENPVPALRLAWESASRYAAVINAARMAEGADEVFDQLRAFVESEGRTAAGLVESSLIEVRDRHVSLLVDGALSDLVAARRDPGSSTHRRVVLQLVPDAFGDLIPPGKSISDFLDAAVESGRLPDETVRSLSDSPGRFEAQMLACAMLVAAERWGPAAQFGARAVELAPYSGRNRRIAQTESAYLLALCLRYSMRGVVQFKRAHELLAENLRRYATRADGVSLSQLRRLRDEMELGTLHLQASVNQELSRLPATKALATGSGRVTLLEDKLSHYWFRTGADRLKSARIDLQESLSLDALGHGSDRGLADQLRSWIDSFSATNLLGAFVYERIVPGLQLGRPAIENPTDELQDVEAEIERAKRSGREPRPILSMYYWATKAILARVPDDRATAIRNLSAVLNEGGQSAQSPLGDRLETAYLRSWAAGHLSPST